MEVAANTIWDVGSRSPVPRADDKPACTLGYFAASDTRPGDKALCGNRITGVINAARDIYSPAGDPARAGVTNSSSEAARREGRSIPSLFNRCISVVRFKPSFIAAPFGPPIFQPLACSAWSMSARSESRSVIGATRSGAEATGSIGMFEGEGIAGTADGRSGFGSTPSFARTTARSTRF